MAKSLNGVYVTCLNIANNVVAAPSMTSQWLDVTKKVFWQLLCESCSREVWTHGVSWQFMRGEESDILGKTEKKLATC